MTDHDDALSDSGWIEGDEPNDILAEEWPTQTFVPFMVESRQGGGGVYVASTTANSVVFHRLDRPQVDELIRMLVVARAEAWPAEGYDGEDGE